MLKGLIARLVDGEDLAESEMAAAMEVFMDGDATPAQMAAFLTALRLKGETVDEITGAARVLRSRATRVDLNGHRPPVVIDREEIDADLETLVDTCGTGGDRTNTFNISTITAFVVAGAGLRVAKHGNRAVSSGCGSADVLEALGVGLDVTPAVVEACIREIGIGFLYAPAHHPAMRHVASVRREMGIRTVFNLLGPLVNPAAADRQVLGVYRQELTPVLAGVLGRLGSRRALVVHGADGLDEFTITGPTYVAELRDGAVGEYVVRPEDVGLPVALPGSIAGGSVAENAAIVREVLEGGFGPRRDVVLLNAAATLWVAEAAPSLRDGVSMAARSIDSGRALSRLEALVRRTAA